LKKYTVIKDYWLNFEKITNLLRTFMRRLLQKIDTNGFAFCRPQNRS